MDFEEIKEKINEIFDCGIDQKLFARKYCLRLIDGYLTGYEKETLIELVNSYMVR